MPEVTVLNVAQRRCLEFSLHTFRCAVCGKGMVATIVEKVTGRHPFCFRGEALLKSWLAATPPCRTEPFCSRTCTASQQAPDECFRRLCPGVFILYNDDLKAIEPHLVALGVIKPSPTPEQLAQWSAEADAEDGITPEQRAEMDREVDEMLAQEGVDLEPGRPYPAVDLRDRRGCRKLGD